MPVCACDDADDTTSASHAYVLTYTPRSLSCLQSQRHPVMAPVKFVKLEAEQWVVPQFASDVGFVAGYYDESDQIVYFD